MEASASPDESTARLLAVVAICLALVLVPVLGYVSVVLLFVLAPLVWIPLALLPLAFGVAALRRSQRWGAVRALAASAVVVAVLELALASFVVVMLLMDPPHLD